MEAFGEYRVGHNDDNLHWIECRGERIAEVAYPAKGGAKLWRYGEDDTVRILSSIPGWDFGGTYPSVGHALADAARSHRRFVEPNPFKRLWRGMALWPAWGKVTALVVGLAALSEILSYVAPNGGIWLVGWFAGLIDG